MYSQAQATAVQVEQGRLVPKRSSVRTVDLTGTLAECVGGCSDLVSNTRPDPAAQDRQASLAFLHVLVMGPTGPYADGMLGREM